MNFDILLILLILIDNLLAQEANLVDLRFFKQESCSVHLEDNDNSRYDPQTHLLYSNDTISDVVDCKVRVRQEANLRFLAALPQLKTTLLCEGTALHSVFVTRDSKTTDHNYGDNDLCKVQTFSYSAFLAPDVFLASPSYIYKFDSDEVLTRYETPEPFSTVHLVFRHGHFVYIVYTNTEGKASIGRMCGNDNGEHNTFRTYRQGRISCTTQNTEHRIVLSAHYEDSNLILLTSRPPVTLSGRVLCSLPLDHIDTMLDTGHFLSYDENGIKRLMKGNNQTCRGELSDLSQLEEVIHGTHTILKSLTAYNTFTRYQDTWYLGADGVLDLRQDLPLLMRSSSSSSSFNNFLIQSITTDIKQPRHIDVQENEVTVIGREAVTFLPLYICSHLQEPGKCYSIMGCSWLIESWKCVISERKLSFNEDHPNGIKQVARKGCQIEITIFTEHNTTLTNEDVQCKTPNLSRNVELVSINKSCMGAVELACKKGTFLQSGHLDRYCLPSGEWSGVEPVCQDQQCDNLEPGPTITVSSTETSVGSLINVMCEDSCEIPINPDPIFCTEAGKWNSTLPVCRRKRCHTLPPLPSNSELVYANVLCGSVHVARCVSGTDLVGGHLLRECLSDGTWSGQSPRCEITSCGALPQPQNGQLTSLSNGIGDVVTVTCSTCHAMSQTSNHTVSMTTECLPSGSWTSQPQCQVVTCPVLEPYKGTVMKRMNNTCIGIAEFECILGQTLASGDLVRHCQTDGTWSGSAPTCEIVTCSPLHLDPSLVVVLEQGAVFGDRVVLECAEGTNYTSGSLELHCHSDGQWHGGSLPVCTRMQLEFVTAVPLPITSDDDENRGLVALAVVGWLLFIASLIFIMMVALLAKRGLLGNDSIRTTFNNKGQDYNKYTNKFERQVTQSTTASLQRSRAGTATLSENERYMF